jgi:hypothetical protein
MQRARRGRQRESALEARCVAWARAHGVQVGKLTQCVGLPDRIFFTSRAAGGPDVPEFKRPSGKGMPSQAQLWHVAQLKRAGYYAWFCDNWEEFLTVMKKRGLE